MSEHAYLKWLSTTDTIYWHDAAIRAGQLTAFANGAVGITTNPFLIQSTLNQDRAFWAERLARLPRGLAGDEKAEALTMLVVGYFMEQLRPLYASGGAAEGYVCAQTSPCHCGDAEYMVEQAKRYRACGENLMVKIPATRAGIEAFEECVALGMNAAATISLTVPQVCAVARAAERGRKRAEANGVRPGLTAAVLMAGRLDDYLRDVAHDTRAEVSERDITTAGVACMKKAYRLLGGKDGETYLLPAGLRGAHQVQELAGAKLIFSLAPQIAGLIPPDAPRVERVDEPADAAAVERLLKMPEFRKAYEEDGMSPDEFITYGAVNRTIDQYVNDGWNLLTAYQYE